MADAEAATKPSPAAEGVAPSSTVDSVEAPPPSQPAATADPPPPTVNGVPEPVPDAAPAAVPVVQVVAAEEAPSKSGGTHPSTGAARVDVSDDSEKTANKYEVHDKDAELTERVAAVLKSARLQVSSCRFSVDT